MTNKVRRTKNDVLTSEKLFFKQGNLPIILPKCFTSNLKLVPLTFILPLIKATNKKFGI